MMRVDLFLEKLERDRGSHEVSNPDVPRKQKVPQRYEIGSAMDDQPTIPKILYWQKYYEALDLITNCVCSRFDQPGNYCRNYFSRLSKEITLNQSYSMFHSFTRMTLTQLIYRSNYKYSHMIVQGKSTPVYLISGTI